VGNGKDSISLDTIDKAMKPDYMQAGYYAQPPDNFEDKVAADWGSFNAKKSICSVQDYNFYSKKYCYYRSCNDVQGLITLEGSYADIEESWNKNIIDAFTKDCKGLCFPDNTGKVLGMGGTDKFRSCQLIDECEDMDLPTTLNVALGWEKYCSADYCKLGCRLNEDRDGCISG
jgi:hypothetical protein